MIPCCLGRLGDACSDAQIKFAAFDRLSKKTGDPKYDKQRPSALSQAAYWSNIVNNCKLATATQRATQQQAAIQSAVAAVPTTAGFDTGKLLTYGGLAMGAAVLLYFVMRRR